METLVYVLIVLFFLSGLIVGYSVATIGYYNRKSKKKVSSDGLKTVRQSLRNPMRTYEISYEKYKGKDSELYQPVRPKRGLQANEVEY